MNEPPVEPGPSIGIPADAGSPASVAAWHPLRESLFRQLWIAAVISYTGTWMQTVGAGWLMAQITMSPLMVGLVQAANNLPVFLCVLPAGALADMVDRRRLLIVTQTWMVVASAALGMLALMGMATPWVLLSFTALLGIGAVMNDPAWQAITPEIVSPPNLASAVALNSAGFNAARAVGPALGGLVVAAGAKWLGRYCPAGVESVEAGAGLSFLVNAVSFLGVIVFLLRWKRRPHEAPEPATRVWHSMKAGLNYVRQTQPVKSVLMRTGAFSVAAAALWAMLPLITRLRFHWLRHHAGMPGRGGRGWSGSAPPAAAALQHGYAGDLGDSALCRRHVCRRRVERFFCFVSCVIRGRAGLDRHSREPELLRPDHVTGLASGAFPGGLHIRIARRAGGWKCPVGSSCRSNWHRSSPSGRFAYSGGGISRSS